MSETLRLAAANLGSPAVLFFVLGGVAVLVRSNLAIPKEVSSFLALYLLMAIGFRGGAELANSGLSSDLIRAGVAGFALGLVIALIAFQLLRRFGRMDAVNAGAVAAHYGSISVVTFMAAQGFLTLVGVASGGYMVAVMALMEAPGLLAGIFLAHLLGARGARIRGSGESGSSMGPALREAMLGGSVLLLLGSFAIGVATGEHGMSALEPAVQDLFPAALALFLLDLGMTAFRRFRDFLHLGRFLVAFGLFMPLLSASLALVASVLGGLSVGDATLLMTLAASASYIAAPAAVRLSLPQANPSLSATLSLGISFPFNLFIGIPLYYTAARMLIGP